MLDTCNRLLILENLPCPEIGYAPLALFWLGLAGHNISASFNFLPIWAFIFKVDFS